jgi:hypothetical protein
MQKQKPAKSSRRAGKTIGKAEVVLRAANGYIVRHYPFGCLGNGPRRLVGKSDFWIVPIFLTSPGYGAVGEVGLVAIDSHTHQVVAATDGLEVKQTIKHLKEIHRDELEAAFHQARTV